MILSGCSRIIPSHDVNVNLEENSHLANKEFFIIQSERDENTRFGLAAVRDHNIKEGEYAYYIVFAPLLPRVYFKDMNEMKLGSSVPITIADAEKFSNTIEVLINDWNKASELDSTLNYRFSPTPNYEFIKSTFEYADWHPFLKFYFELGKNDKKGRLLLGPKIEEYYQFSFDQLLQLLRLQDQLNRALDKIENWKNVQ